MSGWWRAALVLVATAAAFVPTPATTIERFYSGGVYLTLQPRLTSASNRVPVALFDALIVIGVGAWFVSVTIHLVRARRASWARRFAGFALRTAVWAAVAYLSFLAIWGLNYRRVPLTAKLAFDADAVSADAARHLALTAIAEVNALHDRAHIGEWLSDRALDAPLAQAFAEVQRTLGASRPAVPGRPKRSLLDPYFRRAAVQGMTDPYFLETLIESDLLPDERPFAIAHEWSHLAGFADEGEANFVGWLTCLRAGEAERYSGWLFMFAEILGALPDRERPNLSAHLAAGPREALRAIAERIRRDTSPRLSAAGLRVYDRYLKANRVEAGAASYAEVVRLALGVHYGADWTPIRK